MTTVAAGAIAGAEIGALGGPVGAAAGAVVGALIGLGIGLLAVKAIEKANEDADSSLKDKADSTPCSDCGDGPDCFTPPEGADPDEFKRQLKMQQDEINSLSPDQMLKRLADGDAQKAATGSYRGAGDALARQKARDAAVKTAEDKAFDHARKAGKSLAQARQEAAKAGQAAVSGKDALHTIDWVAGGDGKISGMGDSRINRSIGSQWAKTGNGSQLTRREQLRQAALKAKRQGKNQMNVDLKEC